MRFGLLKILSLFTTLVLSQDVYEGYTLFTPQRNTSGNDITTFLIDNDHNIVNTWIAERGVAMQPYLLPDSTLLYPYAVPDPTMFNSGAGGGFQIFNWDGDVIWEATLYNEFYQHHHDIEPLPNGNFLAIAWERKTADEAFGMGRMELNNPLNEMWPEAIFEFQPVGENGLLPVWSWHLWDHLVQDASALLPGFAVISEHPELMDINYGNVGSFQGQPNADWGHFNCVTYNPELDLIMMTSRHFNEIYIIDHSTTTEEAAGHTGGTYGKGGDFLYRWGNPLVYNTGGFTDVRLNGPHAGVWVPQGYSGEGNILVFNNMYQWQNSAVLEIIPPVDGDGNFIKEDGEPFGPDFPAWLYTNSFFSQIQSGALRLPNGNTLITSSNNRRILEVDPDDAVVWQHDYEDDNNGSICRAIKYGPEFFEPEEDFLFGDINEDDILDILDIVSMVGIILGNHPDHPAADINGDEIVDILDVVLLVNLILA